MVRGAYGLQKLRIQSGLRICSNFREKLKSDLPDQDPDGDHDELSKEAEDILTQLRQSFTRLTDGVARNRTLPAEKGFTGDGVISDFSELVLVHQYMSLEKQERQQFAQMGGLLEKLPIYTRYLERQGGIGSAMAAVLVTSFDIHKAERPSQFWAYAGLDVGPDGRARSRRKEHLVEREYTKADGTVATRMGTTFDPWLQSRLMGAMATSFMRTKSSWRKAYDGYKHRIETDPKRTKASVAEAKKLIEAGTPAHEIWTPMRIHRASLRYMVKMFLLDFWTNWREIEGLPIVPSYHEGVMGHKHHDSDDNRRSA